MPKSSLLSTISSPAVPRERPIEVTSAELSRMLRGKPPKQRGVIASHFTNGIYVLVGPYSPAQAAALCRVHGTYVVIARGRSGCRGPRVRTIDRVVRKFGVAPLMAGLDRATAPTPAGNGASNSPHVV
jgi:hypothetical protein